MLLICGKCPFVGPNLASWCRSDTCCKKVIQSATRVQPCCRQSQFDLSFHTICPRKDYRSIQAVPSQPHEMVSLWTHLWQRCRGFCLGQTCCRVCLVSTVPTKAIPSALRPSSPCPPLGLHGCCRRHYPRKRDTDSRVRMELALMRESESAVVHCPVSQRDTLRCCPSPTYAGCGRKARHIN